MIGQPFETLRGNGIVTIRRFALATALLLLVGPLCAQNMQTVFGPRIGISYTGMNPDAYNESLELLFPDGHYFPVNSVFAASLEQRFPLGDTEHFLGIQEVFSVGGMEQSLFIPSLSTIIGFRHASGFEFGAGPLITMGGYTVVCAMGYTFSNRGVYIPVDLSVAIPNTRVYSTIMLSTGFNFGL